MLTTKWQCHGRGRVSRLQVPDLLGKVQAWSFPRFRSSEVLEFYSRVPGLQGFRVPRLQYVTGQGFKVVGLKTWKGPKL